jgi:hypothetical protein
MTVEPPGGHQLEWAPARLWCKVTGQGVWTAGVLERGEGRDKSRN